MSEAFLQVSPPIFTAFFPITRPASHHESDNGVTHGNRHDPETDGVADTNVEARIPSTGI